MRKLHVFFFLLCALCLSVLLSSCNGSGSTEESSTNESEEDSEMTVTEKEGGLRILAVGDVHYTAGTNNAYNNPYILLASQHGYTSDEKLQKFIDGVLAEHEKKPIDAVIILGDIGNNDKSFQYFYKQYEAGRYFNAETETFDSGIDRWGNWKAYMFDVFYQSAYDSIYQVKQRYLDQLTENGIAYYVATGNHDAYTDEMWIDCFGPKYDENGDLVSPSHIGEDGETEYVVTFPEKDAAIVMLDSYAYDEDTDRNGNPVLGPRYTYYMSHDNVAYTPLSTDEARREWFEYTVDELETYKHVYIGAHYFAGNDVVNGGYADDRSYVAEVGNKYGNLRLVMQGHVQVTNDYYVKDESSGEQILFSSVGQWSMSGGTTSYVTDSGETQKVVWSIEQSPWGYTCIESDDFSARYYRITVACHYEYDALNATHVLRHHPEWAGFDATTPRNEPVDIPYSLSNEFVLYSDE